MRNVTSLGVFVASLVLIAFSATAQTLQTSATSTSPRLYKGLVMQAEQHCPLLPGKGVVLKVDSVDASGTAAQVSVRVDCWGNNRVFGSTAEYPYSGSISIDGGVIKLRFYRSGFPKNSGVVSGADLSGGTLQVDATGKFFLVFRESELQAATKMRTNQLFFR